MAFLKVLSFQEKGKNTRGQSTQRAWGPVWECCALLGCRHQALSPHQPLQHIRTVPATGHPPGNAALELGSSCSSAQGSLWLLRLSPAEQQQCPRLSDSVVWLLSLSSAVSNLQTPWRKEPLSCHRAASTLELHLSSSLGCVPEWSLLQEPLPQAAVSDQSVCDRTALLPLHPLQGCKWGKRHS